MSDATDRAIRDAVMTTPAGRRWRRRYLKEAERRRRLEAEIASGAAVRAMLVERAWGMGPGGAGFEKDEGKAHDVKTKTFKADVARKQRLRKAMPTSAKVVRATLAGEGDAGSGEISALLHEPEAANITANEQSSTLGQGRPDGMRSNRAYERCERCGEAHATTAHAAVVRRKAKEAADAFHREYTGQQPVYRGDPADVAARRVAAPAIRAFGEAMGWPAGMDGDRAEEPDGDGDDQDQDDGPIGDEEEWRSEENYRYSADPTRRCGVCRHFDPEQSACTLFRSMVRAVDVCDQFEPAGDSDESEEDD